jgi:hypothetical protein
VGAWLGGCGALVEAGELVDGVVVAGVVDVFVVGAGVVCLGVVIVPPVAAAGADAGLVVAVRPWKALAAISASAPERAAAPTTVQRVTAEIRRSPASRALAARPAASPGERGTRGVNEDIPVCGCRPDA